MKGILEAWDRFWFSRFDPTAVGCFRIGLGLLMLAMFLAFLPQWETYYGADGVVSLTDSSLRQTEDWWSVFRWTEGRVPIRAYWWAGVLSAVCFTVGFLTRFVTAVLYVLVTSMIHRSLIVVNGEDLVFRMLLFYGLFAPLGHSLSVDAWFRRRRTETSREPFIWPVRLMQINIALIYVISLPNKLVDDAAWLQGEAIYLAVASDLWSRWPWPELFYSGRLSPLLTYGTIAVEGLFPILVWFRRTRPYVLVAIASLHLGIAFVLQNVTFFTLAMVCSFCLFVPGDSLRRRLSF